MMKKLVVFTSILTVAACSTAPKQENIVTEAPKASDSHMVQDAPAVKTEESRAAVRDEPSRPTAQASSGQYALLNEGIKEQSDEKIYQGSTQILAQAPNDARALNALAMYHYKRGRYDLCRYLLSKAISAHPRAAELYSNLGIVQLAQGEKREAVQSFRKALEINNTEAVAASNLGAIYTQEKDYGKAQIVLETAYSRGVRYARVLNNYAITLTSQGKY
jgi:Tfp pilus assembly protein PilF